MYLDTAVKRINDIDWDLVGKNASKEDMLLAYEYLRRLAVFFKETGIKSRMPMVANIAYLLGDNCMRIDMMDYCTKPVSDYFVDNTFKCIGIEYYVQMAGYADRCPEQLKYLGVFEPLIRIYERGGECEIRYNEINLVNIGSFSLVGWYSKFRSAKAKSIKQL